MKLFCRAGWEHRRVSDWVKLWKQEEETVWPRLLVPAECPQHPQTAGQWLQLSSKQHRGWCPRRDTPTHCHTQCAVVTWTPPPALLPPTSASEQTLAPEPLHSSLASRCVVYISLLWHCTLSCVSSALPPSPPLVFCLRPSLSHSSSLCLTLPLSVLL